MNLGRFYKLVSMEGRDSIMLGCLTMRKHASFLRKQSSVSQRNNPAFSKDTCVLRPVSQPEVLVSSFSCARKIGNFGNCNEKWGKRAGI